MPKPSWKNEYVKNVQGFAIKFEGSVEQSYPSWKIKRPYIKLIENSNETRKQAIFQ
jgi:hypothetical protein